MPAAPGIPALQVMQCIDKDAEGRIKKHDLMHVRYVPLTRPGETWDS